MPQMIRTTFAMPHETLVWLQTEAARRNQTVSGLFRQLIAEEQARLEHQHERGRVERKRRSR